MVIVLGAAGQWLAPLITRMHRCNSACPLEVVALEGVRGNTPIFQVAPPCAPQTVYSVKEWEVCGGEACFALPDLGLVPIGFPRKNCWSCHKPLLPTLTECVDHVCSISFLRISQHVTQLEVAAHCCVPIQRSSSGVHRWTSCCSRHRIMAFSVHVKVHCMHTRRIGSRPASRRPILSNA